MTESEILIQHELDLIQSPINLAHWGAYSAAIDTENQGRVSNMCEEKKKREITYRKGGCRTLLEHAVCPATGMFLPAPAWYIQTFLNAFEPNHFVSRFLATRDAVSGIILRCAESIDCQSYFS